MGWDNPPVSWRELERRLSWNVTQLPPRPAGAPFEVVFHMTETGLLKVHGREANSGREVRFEIQIGGMNDADVRKAASTVARYQVSG